MKLYNKPELNVEAFDVEDIIAANSPIGGNEADKEVDVGELSAGMEFSIAANGNDEF